MEKWIWFDMDGTIADLYGQDDWLEKLIAENAEPYANARPLVNMNTLARILNRLAGNGWHIGIVSWLSKGSSAEYEERVNNAKRKWLNKHLPSVQFARIDIIPYGIAKNNGRNGILFDDEEPNRKAWNGIAYNEVNIIARLRELQ